MRQSLKDASPHVAGFFTSVVMMPPSATRWTAEARHAALVHELTHIKRGDRRTQAIAQLACAIYWFNPLVWYAAAGLARERERACDDEVLRFGAKPSAYATLLLDLARTARVRLDTGRRRSAWPVRRRSKAGCSRFLPTRSARRTDRRGGWLARRSSTITTAILGAQAATPTVVPQQLLPAAPAAKPRPIVRPQIVMSIDDQTAMPSLTGALVEALG